HPDTPKQVCVALGIPYLDPLLGHVTGLDTAHGAQSTDDIKGESLMLAGDESSTPLGDLAQKGTRAEVPVLYPEVARLYGGQHRPEQGALLGMTVFTRKDIRHQPLRGLIDHQGLPRQGAARHLAQDFEAPVTRLNAIAIHNFHAVPGQPGST